MKASSLNITLALLVFIFWTNPSILWSTRATSVNNSVPHVQDSAPAGWRKIDVEGKFSFYLPPDMRDIGRGSIENLHREYTNGRMHLSFDYEPFFHRAYENRALAFGKDFQEIELQVDGKKSFVFVYQTRDWKNRRLHVAELNVGNLPNGEVIVWMLVDSRFRQAMETAKKIFRTVKFPSSSRSKSRIDSPK